MKCEQTLYTLEEFLKLLELKIQANMPVQMSDSQRRSHAKKMFNDIFGTSQSYTFRNLTTAQEPIFILCDEKAEESKILRNTHSATFVP